MYTNKTMASNRVDFKLFTINCPNFIDFTVDPNTLSTITAFEGRLQHAINGEDDDNDDCIRRRGL